jgi:hypothetical protein
MNADKPEQVFIRRRNEGGGCWAAFFLRSRSTEVTPVKQFLVMKVVESLDKMAGMMALPGLYTLEAAQEFVREALAAEPGSNYFIQEVGTA